LPVPASVPLQTFIDQCLLEPADVGSFQGMDANISMTTTNGLPHVLMSVRLPDGTEMVLLADSKGLPVKR
jgi:hypothetical protein